MEFTVANWPPLWKKAGMFAGSENKRGQRAGAPTSATGIMRLRIIIIIMLIKYSK